MGVTVRRADNGEDRDKCYQIRLVVFVDEQKVPPWEEVDAYDEEADHFLAEIDGNPVGAARLVDKGDGAGKIGRVAVLAEHRRSGVGCALMQHVTAEGFARHEQLALDAQIQVIPFYERLGFVAEGPAFLDAGIEHRRMTRRRP